MPVQELYRRLTVDNVAQMAMMFRVAAEGLSIREAACDWLRAPENAKEWTTWIPAQVCPVGTRLDTSSVNGSSCEECPPGSVSQGVRATACTKCAAGTRTRTHARTGCSWENAYMRMGVARRVVCRLLPARLGAVRLPELRFVGRFLPRARGPAELPSMRQPHAAVPWSSQRSEPKLMPVQGRCVLLLRALYCRRVALKLVCRVLQAIAHS